MKIKLFLLAIILSSAITAQESMDTDYNRWSIEISGGVHKPTRPFSPGYYTSTPSFGQFGLGTRYMFNNRFGLKLDLGYQMLKEGDNSLPFKADYYRASLQGVANLGNIMHFDTWTNSIGLLFHAGAGYSVLNPKEPIDKDHDQMINFIAGISPQIRLGNNAALTSDFSFIAHGRQDYAWDGTDINSRGFNFPILNVSLGLTFYLGQNEKHADWASNENYLDEMVEALDERVSKIETDLIDSDQDGVPDYLDREPNTMPGAEVNSKGIAIDLNKNGIPDEMEAALNSMYVSKEDFEKGSKDGVGIKNLINDGYVNVYFRFNSDVPETYSLGAINYLVTYMTENTSANATLTGYADELGNPEYNLQLSERRANKVKEILVAAGISESRLTVKGGGEDSSVDKSSSPARQLVRRVTFSLD